jgi:beta-galactosidase
VFDSTYTNAELIVRVSLTGSGSVHIKLLDANNQEVGSLTKTVSNEPTVEFSLPVQAPLKWTAESPNLYHLLVSLDSTQYIPHRVGFRQVEMKDGLLKVNGRRIVFRGVNRHEHHPKFGRAVPYEYLKNDLLTMKRHNINAIRTSHQLNDPRLYDLADEMGFWVMDEADLECHGFESIEDAALNKEERAMPFRERQLLTREKAAKWTSDNPDWMRAYVDRAQHLVKRDQLHPSIIVWSCGNEAFFGRNFKAMYDWIKGYDDSRPVHYEADIYAETMDMYSRMYPPVDEIIAFGEDTSKTKPLVLCEFVSDRRLYLYAVEYQANGLRSMPWATGRVILKSTLTPSTSIQHCRVASPGNGPTMVYSVKTRTPGRSTMPTEEILAKKSTIRPS